ncbi:hypothetical protein ACIBF5_09495 [Micromonospora sp. NPDC050417]|uniref:hypothetical protein n=1 Tax=Micromonospora sp. NPDC050417 TaxID=3364280 RepID=UPI003794DB2A
MARNSMTVTVRIDGARQVLQAFRGLPREADQALRDASGKLAATLAVRVQGAARSDSRQAALMGPTVRVVRDRLPAIVIGGSTRVGRKRKPAYKILFGSEFGSNRLKQFRPHLGSHSYWALRTISENEKTMSAEWNRAADRVVRAFGSGGPR